MRCLAAGLATAIVLGSATTALGAESPSCREARERAKADASLLMSPEIVVQAFHIPRAQRDATPLGFETAQDQARAGLSYSLLDVYKGVAILRVADARCALQDTQERARELLLAGDDAGNHSALRKQITYLESRQQEWQSIVAKEEERFAKRMITLGQLTEIRVRATDLERRLARAVAEAQRLDAGSPPPPPTDIGALANDYLMHADDVEQRLSRVRSLSAWRVRLTGGAAATGGRLGWYGVAELSVNLGAFAERSHDARYLAAHAERERTGPSELAARLRDLEVRLQTRRALARAELEVLHRHLALLSEARRAFDGAKPPSAAHAAALLAFDEIVIEAERIYAEALASELSSPIEDRDG